MDKDEAIKRLTKVQHETWQVKHFVEDKYNDAGQLARISKSQHEIWNVKDWLTKVGPTKKRLSADLEYRKLRKMYSAFFLVGGLTLRTDLPDHPVLKYYTDEGFRDVIDKIVSEDLSNVIRVIGMSSFRVDDLGINQHLAPHPVDKNGISDLHAINKVWLDQQKWRLEYMIERGLTVRYIFNDQCSVNGWSWHWLNQKNNHGWNGQKTYPDRYGWFHWTHLSDPDYGTPEERAWYKATGEYIRFMRDYIFHNLLEEFMPYAIQDENEVEAGAGWHHQEADFLNDHKVWKENRITSVSGFEWFHTKNSIPRRWMIECHGIGDLVEYQKQREFLANPYTDEDGNSHHPVTAPWLPSADGKGYKWIDAGPAEIARVLRRSLDDGNLGFQGNSEGRWTNMNPKIYEVAKAMRDEVK